ncbi:hypothetical protein I553_9727 [Mycobacterium xenopi 4042]|uniref:Uncharacterized protein n=1 Tax=Mycobacterium xenopi 4042 TaxID=1299334 RepID=X7YPF7_MYCXE|nr:hypothetical protein I553_9727 [Mycobacterium xenopi 4042]
MQFGRRGGGNQLAAPMSVVTAAVTKPIRVLAFMTADLTGRAERGPRDLG